MRPDAGAGVKFLGGMVCGRWSFHKFARQPSPAECLSERFLFVPLW